MDGRQTRTVASARYAFTLPNREFSARPLCPPGGFYIELARPYYIGRKSIPYHTIYAIFITTDVSLLWWLVELGPALEMVCSLNNSLVCRRGMLGGYRDADWSEEKDETVEDEVMIDIIIVYLQKFAGRVLAGIQIQD